MPNRQPTEPTLPQLTHEREIRELYRERNDRSFVVPKHHARYRWVGELLLITVLAVIVSGAVSVSVTSFLQPFASLPQVARQPRQAATQAVEPRSEVAGRLSQATAVLFSARTAKVGTAVLDQAYLIGEAIGQALVLSSDGWLVTTQAVVPDTKRAYLAATGDGSLHAVTQVVLDPVAPLAYLKVEAQNLAATAFADYGSLAAGQPVIATPQLSQGGSRSTFVRRLVTLEALLPASRAELVTTSEELPDRFLLDDALPRAALGAPVANLQGEVVGLLAGVGEQARAVVPLDSLATVIDGLFSASTVRRPILGVSYAATLALNQFLPEARALRQGALLVAGRRPAVVPGSPAAAAKLQEGDVVLQVQADRVGPRSLSALVAQYRPGTKLELKVWRQGKERNVTVTLGEVTAGAKPAAEPKK